MAFLAPLFLAALVAIAVPVLIHLTHRQRREPIEFPSLMFLRRIEYRTTKRQRIRHPLLFAMRVLAFLLLALAFARPFLRAEGDVGAGGDGGREVVILLDNSFSMGHGDRAARARSAALQVVDGIGAGDRATVVRFAGRAEALLEPTSDRGALRAAVEATRPGTSAGRYAPALSLARGILGRAERPRREVVLVSDLQRTGWVPGEELRLPAGTVVNVVDVGDGPAENVAVTAVEFVRGARDGREQVTATARLANRGSRAAERMPVAVVLDGREVARDTVTVAPNAAANVRLGPFVHPSGVARGTVTAGDDALAGDNVRHFTLDRGRDVGVLLVQDPAVPPSRALYLRRALAIGADPVFRVDLRRAGELSTADLQGRALVIWDDAPAPRGEIARRLRAFVAEGGGLLAVFGDRTRPDDWSGDAASLLAARANEVTDRMNDRGGRLGALDRAHPVFEPFAGPRGGNLGAPRFFRYRALSPADSATVIARFDDGAAALAERRVGRGRLLAFGSTFDNVWNDLPVQPVFLPLVRQLAAHAAGWAAEPAWRTVGEALDAGALAAGADSATAEWVALSPNGEQKRLTGRAAVVELDAPGFWEIRRFGARGAPERVVAVNVDPSESDLARVPRAEVLAALAPAAETLAESADAAPLTATERESRQSLWWFLLLAASLLFAAETVLSNRLARATRVPGRQ